MGMSTPSIDIGAMTVHERIALMGQLWDSLRTNSDAVQLSPEQEADLDRRMLTMQQDGDRGAEWGIVRERIRGHKG